MKYYDNLIDYTNSLTIIDTHEHLPICEDMRDKSIDVLGEYLVQYLSSDLCSAGMDAKTLAFVKDASVPIMSRWMSAEPYWENCRFTGYARALDLAAEKIYKIKRIDRTTIEQLNSDFLKARSDGDCFEHILKGICKIETSLLDCYYPDMYQIDKIDRTYFTPVLNTNIFIKPLSTEILDHFERELNIKISCFDDYIEAVEKVIRRHAGEGSKLLKCSLAYNRPIEFRKVTKTDAECAFNSALKGVIPSLDGSPARFAPERDFQDYIMHRILHIANDLGMTFQFHTGLQEGNGNYISNSDPELLSNLFMVYTNITFDLFHSSYPFQSKAAVLAKNFPNVCLDMCWSHIVSPRLSVNTLLEWLDIVPINKISAFGGDYCFPDGVAGHQILARQNVAEAFSIACEKGIMCLDEAKDCIKAILYDNPKRIFKL